MSQAASPAVKQRTFLGHPIGLYILFFTEMWERFSYYGMRALLVIYMVNFFRYDQKEASTIYKIYTSLVYVTPIIGGYLADRYLGNKRAVVIGAVLMAIGHFLMAFEEFSIFMAALIFLILGNGFFKPNMSTQVGRLYPPNDGRLDGAYTIFYMGINLGAGLSPIVCGWLADNTMGSYHSGFTMAGIGMVIGLLTYLLGQPWVREIAVRPSSTHLAEPVEVNQDATHADVPVSRALTEEPIPLVKKTDALTEEQAAKQPSVFGPLINLVPLLLYSLAGVLFVGSLIWLGILFKPAFTDREHFDLYKSSTGAFNAFMLGLAGFCLFLIGYVGGKVRQGLRDRVLAILVLGVFVMLFWLAGEQAGNVLSVWADKNTDRYITAPMKPAEVETTDLTETPEMKSETGAASETLVTRFQNMFRLKPTPAPKPEPRPALGAAVGPFASLPALNPPPPEQTWGEWFLTPFNPVPTPYFQTINPFAIVLIAPLFAILWIKLDKVGLQPSIPMKMVFGLGLMCLSVVLMVVAARQEGKETSVKVQGHGLPINSSLATSNSAVVPAWWDPFGKVTTTVTSDNGVFVGRKDKDGDFVPFHATLLTYDEKTHTLRALGVVPDNRSDDIIGATAPKEFVEAVKQLVEKSQKIDGKEVKSAEVVLSPAPPGFDMHFSGVKPNAVAYDAAEHKLIARKPLAEKEEKGLLVAAGDPDFRATMHELYEDSNKFRVSSWWLFWSYILATLGELCLSPVGLSMVSKLAPAKFATMMMGVWMLTSAFGNYAAGLLGEDWGTTAPVPFFLRLTLITGLGTLLLLLLVRIVTKTMHGVK